MKTIKEKYQELYQGMRRAEGIAKDQLVDAIYEVVKSEITEHPSAMPQEDWMEYVIDLNDCLHVYLAADVRVCYEAIKTDDEYEVKVDIRDLSNGFSCKFLKQID